MSRWKKQGPQSEPEEQPVGQCPLSAQPIVTDQQLADATERQRVAQAALEAAQAEADAAVRALAETHSAHVAQRAGDQAAEARALIRPLLQRAKGARDDFRSLYQQYG